MALQEILLDCNHYGSNYPQRVRAKVTGRLAVHRYVSVFLSWEDSRPEWRISHVGTGRGLVGSSNLMDAYRLSRALETGLDWATIDQALLMDGKLTPEYQRVCREKVAAIAGELGVNWKYL